MNKILVLLLLSFALNGTAQDVFDAARTGNMEQLHHIAEATPDSLDAITASGFTPLILAIYRNQEEAARFLLDQHVAVDYNSPEGTALHAACFKGDLAMTKILIEHQADVNQLSPRGTPVLIYAVQSKNTELVQLLVNSGADIQATDEYGKTALDYANTLGIKELLGLLQATD